MKSVRSTQLTHWIQRPHASLALKSLVGHTGLRSLDLIALVGKTQGSICSFYRTGIDLAWWVEAGSTWLPTRYCPKGAAEACCGPTKYSCRQTGQFL